MREYQLSDVVSTSSNLSSGPLKDKVQEEVNVSYLLLRVLLVLHVLLDQWVNSFKAGFWLTFKYLT
jgi:hypothetical protein